MDSYKIPLNASDLLLEWYNIIPGLPSLHPATGPIITP
jgi:hypothetical protein